MITASKYCLVFLIGAVISLTSYSQKNKKIYIISANELEVGKSNLIFINRNGLNNDSLILKSSQGYITFNDFESYLLDSLREGKVILSLFKSVNTKLILLDKKNCISKISRDRKVFNSLQIKPNITLGTYKSGKIPIDSVRKISSLSIDSNYIITNAVFYFGQNDVQVQSLKSSSFSQELKKLWKFLRPGTLFSIAEIEFIDKKGNRYKYPDNKGFLVIE